MGRMMGGLLAGLGAGMSQVGNTLEARRQQAIEDAKRMAREQAAAAASFEQEKLKQERADARFVAEEDGRDRRALLTADTTVETTRIREQGQDGRVNRQIADRQNERQFDRETKVILENLSSSNDASVRERVARLEADLRSGETDRLIYGPADANGNSPVIIIPKRGKPIDTGYRAPAQENQDGRTGGAGGANAARPSPWAGAGTGSQGTETTLTARRDPRTGRLIL